MAGSMTTGRQVGRLEEELGVLHLNYKAARRRLSFTSSHEEALSLSCTWQSLSTKNLKAHLCIDTYPITRPPIPSRPYLLKVLLPMGHAYSNYYGGLENPMVYAQG